MRCRRGAVGGRQAGSAAGGCAAPARRCRPPARLLPRGHRRATALPTEPRGAAPSPQPPHLALGLADAPLTVARELRPRGGRHQAVAGRVAVRPLLAVLHLVGRGGGAGGGDRWRRAGGWWQRPGRGSAAQRAAHSATQRWPASLPHPTPPVQRPAPTHPPTLPPTWSSRRRQSTCLDPVTGSPQPLQAALSSATEERSLVPSGSSWPAVRWGGRAGRGRAGRGGAGRGSGSRATRAERIQRHARCACATRGPSGCVGAGRQASDARPSEAEAG